MGEIEMKHDLQEAIANGVKDYKSDYGSLLFCNDTKEYLKTLYYMEQLNIKIDGGRLLYHIKLNEEQLKTFSSEEIQRVKLCNFLNKVQKTFLQKLEESDLISVETICFEEKEVEVRRATENQLNFMATIKETLKDVFNIDFEIKESEHFLSLEVEKKEINLTQNMLRALLALSDLLDVIAIVPCFCNEEIIGIRMFLAINLEVLEK